MRAVRVHGRHFNGRQLSDLTFRLWDESPFEGCVCVWRGGGRMRATKIPQQDFALKLQRGFMHEGGRICGTLRYTVS